MGSNNVVIAGRLATDMLFQIVQPCLLPWAHMQRN